MRHACSVDDASPAALSLRDAFVARRGRDVETLCVSIECGDSETVARLAHNMRGMAPSYGFPDLAALGERLEAAANEGRIDDARREVDRLAAWVAEQSGGTAPANTRPPTT